MAEYVYVLSSYGEYGAENAVATLDKSLLLGLLRKHFSDTYTDIHQEYAALEKLLLLHDEAYLAAKTQSDQSIDLSQGWGGIQLHVIALEGAHATA